MIGTAARHTQSPFTRRLRAAVIAAYEPEIDLTCRVAIFTAAGFDRSEIARRTGATPAAIREAIDRLRIAAPNLVLHD